MTIEKIKKMMDACYLAKRAWDMLPSLPQSVAPSYIHYLDIIEMLESRGVRVKVSDISETLNLPRPGVTRTVKEMEQKGYLQKTASEEDGRVTYISATEDGKALSEKYNRTYFGALVPYLSDISEEDADCAIQTIEKFYHVMSERRIDLE